MKEQIQKLFSMTIGRRYKVAGSGFMGMLRVYPMILAFSVLSPISATSEVSSKPVTSDEMAEAEAFDSDAPRTGLTGIWEANLRGADNGSDLPVLDLSVSADESWVIALQGKSLFYVNAADGRYGNLPFAEADAFPTAVAFSPRLDDGNVFLLGFTDGGVFLLELADNQLNNLGSFDAHESMVRGVGISPIGNFLLTAAENGEVRIWDSSTGEVVHDLKGSEGAMVLQAHFSPDGQSVWAALANGEVISWSVDSGEVLHRLAGHDGPVLALDFSADGKTILTGSADETARLWSTKTGEPLARMDCAGPVWAAAFAPADSRLILPREQKWRLALYDSAADPSAARLGILHEASPSRVITSAGGLIVSGDRAGGLIASRLRSSVEPRFFDFRLADEEVRKAESTIRHEIRSGPTLNLLEALNNETEIRERLVLFEVDKTIRNTRDFRLPSNGDELFDLMQMASSYIRAVDYGGAVFREVESGGDLNMSMVLNLMGGGLMNRLMRSPAKTLPLQESSYFQVVHRGEGETQLFGDGSEVDDHRQVWYVDVDPHFFDQVHIIDPLYGRFRVQDPVVPGEQWEVKSITYFSGRPSRVFSGDDWGSSRHRWIQAAFSESLPEQARVRNLRMWAHYASRMGGAASEQTDVLKVHGSFTVLCEGRDSSIGEGTLTGRIHVQAPDGPINGRQLKAVLYLEEPGSGDEESKSVLHTRHEIELITGYTHEALKR